MKDMHRLEPLLRCLSCREENLVLDDANFACRSCEQRYPIIDGILRFVPESYYRLDDGRVSVEERTKNYFGHEWDVFRQWGFIKDEDVTFSNQRFATMGGTIQARGKAFGSKCRLAAADLVKGKVVLDAGCGNGRYTYEAASRGDALLLGVDISYGAVQSAHCNNEHHENVFIIQASLFDLPFRDEVIDCGFSNGVLMHTGNAHDAFGEICRVIKPSGVFVTHLYHKLNPVWEINDRLLRAVTTRMSVNANMKLAAILARIGVVCANVPYLLRVINLFLRLQPSIPDMYDWYSAPVATHHTCPELAEWYAEYGF